MGGGLLVLVLLLSFSSSSCGRGASLRGLHAAATPPAFTEQDLSDWDPSSAFSWTKHKAKPAKGTFVASATQPVINTPEDYWSWKGRQEKLLQKKLAPMMTEQQKMDEAWYKFIHKGDSKTKYKGRRRSKPSGPSPEDPYAGFAEGTRPKPPAEREVPHTINTHARKVGDPSALPAAPEMGTGGVLPKDDLATRILDSVPTFHYQRLGAEAPMGGGGGGGGIFGP